MISNIHSVYKGSKSVLGWRCFLKEREGFREEGCFSSGRFVYSRIHERKSIRKEVKMTTKRDLSRNGGIREASARVATPALDGISTRSTGGNIRCTCQKPGS